MMSVSFSLLPPLSQLLFFKVWYVDKGEDVIIVTRLYPKLCVGLSFNIDCIVDKCALCFQMFSRVMYIPHSLWWSGTCGGSDVFILSTTGEMCSIVTWSKLRIKAGFGFFVIQGGMGVWGWGYSDSGVVLPVFPGMKCGYICSKQKA